jgi:XTP/dITP diphosphohydrolase
MSHRLRVATQNAHKLRELREMLEPRGWQVLGTEDIPGFEVVEDGATFRDNAVKKARALCERTGEAALADDSGLVVDALGGEPGVHSARFSGVDGAGKDAANRAKLLSVLAAVPDPERTARFVCALAWIEPGRDPLVVEGRCEGAIGHVERGGGGFGYDPLFLVREHPGRTMAELAPAEKNAVSHRGRALEALLLALRFRGGGA